MPDISYTTVMNAPRLEVWEFVRDINNWAPFTPGYQTHEVLNERESLWTVRGEVGPISRITKFHVTVTEWMEGERVAFVVRGLNEPITGQGAINLSDNGSALQTSIKGDATVTYGGSMGPVVNPLLVPFVKSTADQLVNSIVLAVTGEALVRKRGRIAAAAAAMWTAVRGAVRWLLSYLRR